MPPSGSTLVIVATALALAAGPAVAQSEQVVAAYGAGEVQIGERRYPYRLLEPPPERIHSRRPLVVFLHGAGERGDDNRRQLTWLPAVLARDDLRRRYACYVLAVQCPREQRWVETPWGEAESRPLQREPSPALQAVVAAMDEVLATRRVDPARVYLTGLSMGGYGTWDLAARLPDRFAAALAVCGGGDERIAGRLVGLPLGVWHGAEDRVVPVARSRAMVAALRSFGAEVRYHELDGVGHDVWRQAYGDDGALPWLFGQDQRQQQRGAHASFAVVPRADAVEVADGRFELLAGARCVAAAGAEPAAQLFARALLLETGHTVAVVGGPADAGDVVFELSPDAGRDVELVVGDRLAVRAADVGMLRRGAALALQALLTWPDLSCPRGRLRVAPRPGGRIVAGEPGVAWSGVQVMRLLRIAWLFGATEVAGIGLARHGTGQDPATRESVEHEARRFGVRLLPDVVESHVADVVWTPARTFELSDLLSQPCPEPAFFELRMPPDRPDRTLRALYGALAAAVECASGRRRMSAAVLAGRLGALMRRSVLP